MFKFALVVLLCAQAFARPHVPEIESHIVGGTPANEGDYPFMVSVRLEGRDTFCGGALLSEKYVATAAHCVDVYKPLEIGAGSIHLSKQKVFPVDKIIVHPKWDEIKNINDIALLRMKKPIPIGGNIQTINFPVKENLDDKNVTALGWGQTSVDGPYSQVLLHLKRSVLPNKECSKRLNNHRIHDGQICFNGEKDFGMCFGDSGSPLLYKGADGKNYIAGIVSWGVPCAKGFPDVYTRVSYYADWVKLYVK